ncbi:MAG: hypothetical protein IPG50_13395 [Myxococcales bacterium]|nr:hypothetical protein [Myxococcales bacterium]
MLTLVSCAAHPSADGRAAEAGRGKGTAVARPIAPSSLPPRSDDCRRDSCLGIAETCVNVGGCGGRWACVECANAWVHKPVAFCGCDGVTFFTNVIGCDTRESAHPGACP